MGDAVGPRYQTQRRWMECGGRLLGLSSAVEAREAERIAEELDLGALEHRAARQCFAGAQGLRERGEVVVSVLDSLALDASLWPRLLAAGEVGGLWGRAWWWSPRAERAVAVRAPVARAVRGPPPCVPTKFVLPRGKARP